MIFADHFAARFAAYFATHFAAYFAAYVAAYFATHVVELFFFSCFSKFSASDVSRVPNWIKILCKRSNLLICT